MKKVKKEKPVKVKRQKKDYKLGTRLCVIIGCVLIPLVAVTAIVSSVALKPVAKDVLSEKTELGFNTLSSTLDYYTLDIDRMAQVIRVDANVINAIKANDAEAVDAAVANTISSPIRVFAIIYDSQGKSLWSSGVLPKNLSGLDVLSSSKTDIYADDTVLLSERVYRSIYDTNGDRVGGICVGYDMTDYAIVDSVMEKSGVNVTLFKGDTRVSTTIQKDGARVIGTTMAENIADIVLKKGQSYSGETFVVIENMIVEYKPLTNLAGETLGAIFAGQPTTSLDSSYSTRTLLIAGAAALLLLVLIIIMLSLMTNIISKPIKKVVAVASELEHGNLHTDKLNINTHNEISQLADTMNRMTDVLDSYISDISTVLEAMSNKDLTVGSSVEYAGDFKSIKNSIVLIRERTTEFVRSLAGLAEKVYSSSQQISRASQAVANGTTSQAGSLHELSVSIGDVSDNVEKNANDAKRAKELSDTTEVKISEQNEKMAEALEAMKDIENKSSKIQSIIKTIEDIAFQTNILALNAAVEAARAGAAGKGFAVVADEVRNLASKSSEAANNTSELIKASIDSVRNGSDILSFTAESLNAVVELSTETHSLIENISAQSLQQSEAIKQITIGIDQISDVVQQNSATAEETSATSEELFAQSDELQNLVKQYRY